MSTLEQELRELASTSVDVSDGRVADLEDRVVRAIAADGDRGTPVVVPIRRGRKRARSVLIGSVAAAVLAVIVLAAGWFTATDDSVVIAAADEVSIVFGDGTRVDARAGQEVPEGATLVVEGSVEIDGVRYGPGVYLVDDGELAIVAGLAVEPEPNPIEPVDSDVDSDRDEPRPATTRPAAERPTVPTTVADRIPSTTPVPTTTPRADEPRPTRPPSTVDVARPTAETRPVDDRPPTVTEPTDDRPRERTTTTTDQRRDERPTTTQRAVSETTVADVSTTVPGDRPRRP